MEWLFVKRNTFGRIFTVKALFFTQLCAISYSFNEKLCKNVEKKLTLEFNEKVLIYQG